MANHDREPSEIAKVRDSAAVRGFRTVNLHGEASRDGKTKTCEHAKSHIANSPCTVQAFALDESLDDLRRGACEKPER